VKRRLKREQGVALLAALLAIALMTLVVVDFMTSSALGYMSAANQANDIKATYLARSAIGVGLGLLEQDSAAKANAQEPCDSLFDIWAMPFPPMGVDGGIVSLSIVDEARKIPINQIIDRGGNINAQRAQQLGNLINVLGMPPELVPAILDWLDPDDDTLPGGAESDYYMHLIPPYATRNGPMPTIGDLRLVRGVNDVIFAKLSQYLTVAPETRVNINTAAPEVIASIDPGLMENPKIVGEILAMRSQHPFNNVTDIGNLPGLGNEQNTLMQNLTTRSTYFTISGMGTFAGARRAVYGTFRRNPNGTAILGGWKEE